MTARPYPLSDEIKMHVFLWAADADWRTLPDPLKQALTVVMNEIKIGEAMKRFGGTDDRTEKGNVVAQEKRRFIAVFKQKYLEYCDFPYDVPMDEAAKFILGMAVKKLRDQGADCVDYLNWFFDDFLRDEYNKKTYAPPTLKIVTSNVVMNKFLFACKDRLKARRWDTQQMLLNNAVMALVTKYLERHNDKEFGEKALCFSRGEISRAKFSGIFLTLLHRDGETELETKLKEVLKTSDEQV